MATPKSKKLGQPDIMVAETVIGRECVTFALPKSILSQINLSNGQAFFCITNGVIQISGDVPTAVMPAMILNEESFMPQGE